MMQVIHVKRMQWEHQCHIEPDVIFAADVLYDPGKIERHGPAACMFLPILSMHAN